MSNIYVQIPVKDSKNSLFLMLQELQMNKSTEETTVKIDRSIVFVARNIEQQMKYNLLSFENIVLTKQSGISYALADQVKLTLNENYILLLANIVESQFDDCIAIY